MSTVAVTIARMRWWHIAEIVPIEAELFGAEQWTDAMFWNELANGYFYVVALAGDEVVGYGGLAMSGDEAWVQNLAVRGDHQGGGLGRRLLATLLDEAVRRDASVALLEVAVDNAPAQHLYAAFGFEGVGVRRGYYQPSNTDALVMRKDF